MDLAASRVLRSASTVSIFQPALQVIDNRLAVEIDGRRQDTSISIGTPFNSGYRAPGSTNHMLNVLVSRGVDPMTRAIAVDVLDAVGLGAAAVVLDHDSLDVRGGAQR